MLKSLFGFTVVVAIICVLSQRHSLFGVLLGFKALGILLFFWLMVFWGDMQSLIGFGLIFLCMEVCVMCVSLALMVSLVKGVGSDYVGAVAIACV